MRNIKRGKMKDSPHLSYFMGKKHRKMAKVSAITSLYLPFKINEMPHQKTTLNLPFGLTFADLYHRDGLKKLDQAFLNFVQVRSVDISFQYSVARQGEIPDESALLLSLARLVEEFIGGLFDVDAAARLHQEHQKLSLILEINRQFVQRVAIKKYPKSTVSTLRIGPLRQALQAHVDVQDEQAVASQISRWLDAPENYQIELDIVAQYAAWAAQTVEGQKCHPGQTLFSVPHKLDPEHLIPVEATGIHGAWQLPDHQQRLRKGFSLTDPGLDRASALHQANYCIWCHHQGKDSCSKGLKPKKKDEDKERFQKNVFGTPLIGCPLEQKISEMNEVKSQGLTLAALAIIMIDNPMVPATGHRICNDCMKACIYQKQDPVNIPGVETQILKETLSLPWGVEIYSLLTRWNPLNFRRPLMLPDSGYKVLVVGTGPAGFTLAHHLMNDGHTVVAIDGLKVEPLPSEISGVDRTGQRVPFRSIKSFWEIEEDLKSRINGGFGGVAEYGITVRWDKNFLKLIRLVLERRSNFGLFGGIRFGGTLSIDQAFNLGFDHIALCMGAGSPTLIPMKNSLAPGVRQASDFLMALQLTGAAKESSIANLQLRLPVVVIGGGLTAIDTATEAMAYYPIQVEKFAKRYHELVDSYGSKAVEAQWTLQDNEIAGVFLDHAESIRTERHQAQLEGRLPNFQKLVQSWGGVTVVYRRPLVEAPSYTLNHEEVAKALEEGISILDQTTPEAVEIDGQGHTVGLKVQRPEGAMTLPARAILIAAGTKPNINLSYDDPHFATLSGQTFQAVDDKGAPALPERLAKPAVPHVVMSLRPDQTAISFFGDMHPSFSGNVVKAMGSAKQGYPVISRLLKKKVPSKVSGPSLLEEVSLSMRATVQAVNRLTPTIIEVVIHAPYAAQAFRPGQFYRLQNYESLAPMIKDTRLAMEGLALTGASVDRDKGLLSMIVLEMGGSSDLCAHLKPGEPVVLMGPTGSPTEIPEKETVMLVGGGLGNAVLFSIGQAMREKGCRVVYFTGYRKLEDRYKESEIEAAADVVVWCCDETPGFIPTRTQDRSFVGNLVEAIAAYGREEFGPCSIALSEVQRLIVIGSDRMMGAVAAARYGVLAPFLHPDHLAIGSINSPMQCMMKEICAQCLQRHVDPVTGEERIVYSCANQDQLLDQVDFKCLSDRLSQNSLSEKLTHHWVRHCLKAKNK
jgi:NADPH-dependent glutamate synthase beta subunit-like oxidoreductase/NAD(P)H-flavin reductase